MHNEFAKCEIKTSVFSGRKSQVGNCCTMANSSLQQASPGAVQNLFLKNETKADAKEFVRELLSRIEELGLNEKDQDEIVVHAQTAETQLKLKKPKPIIVQGCLEGIKETIQGAVKTSMTGFATWALSQIEHILSSGQF